MANGTGGSSAAYISGDMFVDMTGNIPFHTTHETTKFKEAKLTHPPP